MTPRRFPKALRIESKFSTGTTIVIPQREREALLSRDRDVVGVIAALFLCGERDLDGRWFMVDARESFRSGPADGGSLRVQDLLRIEKSQAWLAGVRSHVEEMWPRFLRAFRDEVMLGHEALCTELKEVNKLGRLHERLAVNPVLELEHRNAVCEILEHHGAAVAGHIFQDLLAYLLALAGYKRVQINPIGVPDIEVSDFQSDLIPDFVTLTLTREQADRLMKLCQDAGEGEFVEVLIRSYAIV